MGSLTHITTENEKDKEEEPKTEDNSIDLPRERASSASKISFSDASGGSLSIEEPPIRGSERKGLDLPYNVRLASEHQVLRDSTRYILIL